MGFLIYYCRVRLTKTAKIASSSKYYWAESIVCRNCPDQLTCKLAMFFKKGYTVIYYLWCRYSSAEKMAGV
jgi:hypothetical protein